MQSLKPATRRALQNRILDWFDTHQRVMPWRARKGQRPDPYHVWLSEIMLQQTTVVAVVPYFERFIKRWPTVADLAAASLDEVLAAWAGLGYYARARNLHACARVVAGQGGRFPQTVDELQALPGIGPYTAAAIASIAFDQPASAVDGNVERVVSRFFAVTDPLPASKPLLREKAAALGAMVDRPGDFTQAFMELGATVCVPRTPRCTACPWRHACAGHAQGIAGDLPRKSPKKKRPQRYGHVYIITDHRGRVLLEKRAGKGLYQGMYQAPTTQWHLASADLPKSTSVKALSEAGLAGIKPRKLGEVRHVLTHFDLFLEVHAAHLDAKAARAVLGQAEDRQWVTWPDLGKYGVPKVMTKALSLVRAVQRDD